MPRLRLQFPFLWKDRVEGRAKRSLRDQPRPILLNSYRAHLRCISCMAYIDELRLVLRYLPDMCHPFDLSAVGLGIYQFSALAGRVRQQSTT